MLGRTKKAIAHNNRKLIQAMTPVPDEAGLFIAAQLNIVRQLQNSCIEAIQRNDWQNVDRVSKSIDLVFGTFLEGVKVMAIDVSALKNVLSSGGAGSTDAIATLQSTLQAKIDDLTNQLSNTTASVEEIKAAIQELEDAAKSSGGTAPTPPALPV